MATIKQVEKFVGVNSAQVYNALMDSKQHSEFTGAKATIDNCVGGKISAWDDYIEGENLTLTPDKKIVQKWRANDWPEDSWSRATFELKDIDGGCELTFSQTDVPDNMAKDVEQGWTEYYWTPLRKYFSK